MADTLEVTVFVAVNEQGEALADVDRDNLEEQWSEQQGTTLGVTTYELVLTLPRPGPVRVGVSLTGAGRHRLRLVEE